MIHTNSVHNDTLELLKNLQAKPYMKDFILVGGTALALQIGHRLSVDLDLFCKESFNAEQLHGELYSDFGFIADISEPNTLVGSINDIKVDLMKHPYPSVSEVITLDAIRMASKEDIVAMKLNAISNSGQRVKDFIDVYFLLKAFDLEEMLNFYCKKYGQKYPPLHVIKSLTYFDDVESGDWPELFSEKELILETVMKRIERTVRVYLNR